MLCVDHLTAGIIFPSLFDGFQNAPAILISVISSVLPDISGIHGWQGNIKYLSHRKATHSFIFAPILSIIPVVLIYSFFGQAIRNTLMELYLLSLSSIIFHILLDIVTPFGTQIFYPLSEKKISLDLFPSLEPITISISVIFISSFVFCIIFSKFPNAPFFLIFLLLYFLYVLFSLIKKFLKSKKFRQYLKSIYPEAIYIKTIPRAFGRWKGIAKIPSNYIVMSDVRGEDKFKLYSMEFKIPENIKTSVYYKRFINYARFPVVINYRRHFSLINLIYSPYSFRFDFEIDDKDRLISLKFSGFKLTDRGI